MSIAVIVIVAVCGIALGAFLTRCYSTSLIDDQGWTIFTSPDARSYDAIVELLGPPRWRLNTPLAKRSIYPHGLVLNLVSDKSTKDWVGDKLGAIARRVQNPLSEARSAVAWLHVQGFKADLLSDPDPTVNRGAMVFVKTDALPFLIIYRKHVVKMTPKGGQRPKRVKS